MSDVHASPAGQHAPRPTEPRLGQRALRVPQVMAIFWLIKALSTAMGESTSDFLVHAINPVVAVLLGFVAFWVAIFIQLRQRHYVAWAYWLAVCMVGVFGTMAADVVHVAFGVPYVISSAGYGVALAIVFVSWHRVEGTLSIHTIDTPRRELFYWAAVAATFATGTALGDFTAYTLNFGYFGSIFLYAALIAVPAVGYFRLGWNPVFSFWAAYVMTRPFGASVADWLAKPTSYGGMAIGDGPVAIGLTLAIAVLVGYLTVTRRDVQQARPETGPG